MPRAEQITPPVAAHGEGPVWDQAGQQLLGVDLEEGLLVRYDPGTGAVARHRVADVLACLRPRASGGWVAAVERRFAVLDAVPTGFAPAGGAEPTALESSPLGARMLPALWERGDVRFNEGACDPQGRFWCGSMAYDQSPGAGSLWRLDPDGTTSRVLDDVTVSNGLQWVDEGTAYYVDTPTARVDVLRTDPATGAVLERTPFATLPEDAGGRPDGLVVDAEGGVWVAVFGGSAVRRYDPDGALAEVVDVGASQVTAATFGGPDLATLFITTSTQGSDEPGAGALFAHSPGVRGVLPLPYAG